MTDEELCKALREAADTSPEAIAALLDGVTPGPWRVDGPPWNQIIWCVSDNRVCFMAHSSGLHDDRDIATARFIAAARDLVPALAAERDALTDRIEALVKERDELLGAQILNRTAIRLQKQKREAAEALIADCAEYLKEGETPRQRMDRDHKDVLALLDLLAKEKIKREAAEDALKEAVCFLQEAVHDLDVEGRSDTNDRGRECISFIAKHGSQK